MRRKAILDPLAAAKSLQSCPTLCDPKAGSELHAGPRPPQHQVRPHASPGVPSCLTHLSRVGHAPTPKEFKENQPQWGRWACPPAWGQTPGTRVYPACGEHPVACPFDAPLSSLAFTLGCLAPIPRRRPPVCLPFSTRPCDTALVGISRSPLDTSTIQTISAHFYWIFLLKT